MFLRFSKLKNFDWPLLTITVLLVLVGLTIIYSVTLSELTPDYSLLLKQIIFFGIGLLLLFIFAFLDYRILGSVYWIIYIFALLFLVLVLFFGVQIRGTRGWFQFWEVNFQPVEFLKLALVIFLAKFLAGRIFHKVSLKVLFVSLFFVLMPSVLVMAQPDLGSTLVLLLSWIGLLWISGMSAKHFFAMAMILLLVLACSWFFLMKDYQKERVLNFLDPARDPLGKGYNVRQSLVAVGSGGFLGRGLGFGTQSQLRFLPETEADFVFASLSEELGFLGSFLLLILYSILFWRIYVILKNLRDNFSKILTFGISLIFFIHIFINIGMNLGFLPVTGLSLPFISSGGSFLLISMVGIGILESIAVRNKGNV